MSNCGCNITPDLFTLHGPHAVDPSLRHDVASNTLPLSLIDEVGADLPAASNKAIQGLQVGMLHGRWPGDQPRADNKARFEKLSLELGQQVASRKLDTFSTLFEVLAAPRLMPASHTERPVHGFEPKHGEVVVEGDDVVYAVDLSRHQPDTHDIVEVIRFAHACVKNWDNGGETKYDDVDEIVSRCVQALGIGDAIEEYRRYLGAGHVVGIDLSRTEYDSDTPVGVCHYFVSAQYALGDKIDWGMLSDVSQVVRSMAQQLYLDAPAPRP